MGFGKSLVRVKVTQQGKNLLAKGYAEPIPASKSAWPKWPSLFIPDIGDNCFILLVTAYFAI